MDFEAIWHTHKPFILRVGAGALVFLVLMTYQGWVVDEAVVLAGENRDRRAQVSRGVDTLLGPRGEGFEKGRAAALEERLQPAILDAVLWEAGDGYELPDGTELSPRLYYVQQLKDAEQRIDDARAQWNAAAPSTAEDLGLEADVPDARIPEALARADVVQRLVCSLIDAGVRRLRDVSPDDVTYQQLEGLGGYLRAVPVEAAFEGDAEVLAAALSELTEAGSFLELRALEVERQGDRPDSPVVVSLTVQALSLVSEPPASAEPDDGGRRSRPARRRGPVRFGRER